jgi:3'(2'), 5'-bisphosphate nucleotidase
MPDPLPEVLAEARRAARLAARLCEMVAGDAAATMAKAGGEPVTLADYGAQAVILRIVATRFPHHGVIAEEHSENLATGRDGSIAAVAGLVSSVIAEDCSPADVTGWIDHRGGGGPVSWAVDPIDGTKGFIRGDQYAVAVGLLRDGAPVAGVLACPRLSIGGVTGVLVWGGPGLGAFVEPLSGGGPVSVSVSPASEAVAGRVLGSVERGHGDDGMLAAVIDEAGLGGGWVRMDSQAKYAAVAAGVAEVYVRPVSSPGRREWVWDHAAGSAVVTGAGGRVSDLDGRPLDFSAGAALGAGRGVVATNGGLHDVVLGAIRTVEAV